LVVWSNLSTEIMGLHLHITHAIAAQHLPPYSISTSAQNNYWGLWWNS